MRFIDGAAHHQHNRQSAIVSQGREREFVFFMNPSYTHIQTELAVHAVTMEVIKTSPTTQAAECGMLMR